MDLGTMSDGIPESFEVVSEFDDSTGLLFQEVETASVGMMALSNQDTLVESNIYLNPNSELANAIQDLPHEEKQIKGRMKSPGWLQSSTTSVRFFVDTLFPRGCTQKEKKWGRSLNPIYQICEVFAEILLQGGVNCHSDTFGQGQELCDVLHQRIRKGCSKNPVSEKAKLCLCKAIGCPSTILSDTKELEQKLKEIYEDHDRLYSMLESNLLISLRDFTPAKRSRPRSPLPDSRRPGPGFSTSRPGLSLFPTPTTQFIDFLKESIIWQLDFLKQAVNKGFRHTGIAQGLKIAIECYESAQQCPSEKFYPQYKSALVKDMVVHLIDEMKESVSNHPDRVSNLKFSMFPLLEAFEQFCEQCFKMPAVQYRTRCHLCIGAHPDSSDRSDEAYGSDGSSGGSSHGSGSENKDYGGDSGGGGANGPSTGNGNTSFYPNGPHGGGSNNCAVWTGSSQNATIRVPLADGKSSFVIKHDANFDGYVVVHNSGTTEDEDNQSIRASDGAACIYLDQVPINSNQPEQLPPPSCLTNKEIFPQDEQLYDNLVHDLKLDEGHPDADPVADSDTPIDPDPLSKNIQGLKPNGELDQKKLGNLKMTPGDKTTTQDEGLKLLPKINLQLNSLRGENDCESIPAFLVSTMKLHRNWSSIQLFCLNAIWDICKKDHRAREIIMSTSVVSEILHAMKTNQESAKVQETACGAIWSLASRQENRIEIANGSLVDYILISALRKHPNDKYVVEMAIGALRSLSPEPLTCKIIKGWEAIRYICEAMETHTDVERIQAEGCYLLSNLAFVHGESRVHKACEYELRAVLQAMQNHVDKQDVASAACFALKNYTWREENLKALSVSAGILDLLEKLATTHGKKHALRIIERLEKFYAAQEEDRVCEEMLKLGEEQGAPSSRLTSILEIMNRYSKSKSIFLCGVQSIHRIGVRNEISLEAMRDKKLLGEVINGMGGRFKSCPDVQTEGCNFLKMIARDGDTDCRRAIIGAGGCETLIEVFRRHRTNVEVKICISTLLRELSVEHDCWFEFEAQSRGGANGIVDEMMNTSPNDPEIEENAYAILMNFMVHTHV